MTRLIALADADEFDPRKMIALFDAVDDLPPELGLLVRFRFLQEPPSSLEEIAAMTRLDTATVATRLERAIEMLTDALRDRFELWPEA